MLRFLTNEEIDSLLDFIVPFKSKSIPIESSLSMINGIKEKLRKQLVKIKIYEEIIPELKNELKKNYFSSLIPPGESVGIIAAQSIGEKQTQTVLNSVDWKEEILYVKNNDIFIEPIGKMIDNLLLNFSQDVEKIKENRTEYLNLQDGYYIPSCDEYGKTGWYKIEAVTKHLPVGDLVEVITEFGRNVIATQSKSFLVWNDKDNKFIATQGSDIKIGDILPTTKSLKRFNDNFIYYYEYKNIKINLDKDTGFIIGLYLTNNIENLLLKKDIRDLHNKWIEIYGLEEKFFEDITNNYKNIPNFIFNSGNDFIKGFISGYFTNSKYNDNFLEIKSLNKEIICSINFLLTYFNFFGKIEISEYYILKIFNISKLDFEILDKSDLKFNNNYDVCFDKVISINYVKGTTEYVYDLTVEHTRNFQLFNGLNVRDTFHRAGQSEKTVVQGVPRFLELLNASRNPRVVNCKLFLKDGNKNIKDLKENISSKIKCLTLKDLSKNITVEIDKKPEKWYDIFKLLYNNNFEDYNHCISIKLNSEIMYRYKINVLEISKIIEKEYNDLFCVFSPINNEQLDIFVDVSNIKFTEEKLLFINPENINEIYIEECVQPILEKIIICGIPGITDIYYTNEKDEWFVETDGSNFRKLLGLNILDITRLESNNVWDIYENLGIEAAREFLINEFICIMGEINPCHVKLLVDKMTYTGTISSISRYTLRKDESGPISKASFEESVDLFLKAGFAGDIERTKGVSASIVCGKRAKCGTGFIDLKIDVAQLKNSIPVFLDKNNEGVVKEEKAITKLKPYFGKL